MEVENEEKLYLSRIFDNIISHIQPMHTAHTHMYVRIHTHHIQYLWNIGFGFNIFSKYEDTKRGLNIHTQFFWNVTKAKQTTLYSQSRVVYLELVCLSHKNLYYSSDQKLIYFVCAHCLCRAIHKIYNFSSFPHTKYTQ